MSNLYLKIKLSMIVVSVKLENNFRSEVSYRTTPRY